MTEATIDKDALTLTVVSTFEEPLSENGPQVFVIGRPEDAALRAAVKIRGRLAGKTVAIRFLGTGRTVANGGAGDSSVLTAYGVFQGMRAAAQHAWGDTSLAGRTVGVAGVDHQRAEVRRVGDGVVRELLGDALVLAQLVIGGGVGVALGRRDAAHGPGARAHRDRSRPRSGDKM